MPAESLSTMCINIAKLMISANYHFSRLSLIVKTQACKIIGKVNITVNR